MKSPLEIYTETAKKFGITSEQNVPDVNKLSFAREQQFQQMAIVNRLLFDLTTTQIHLSNAKDDVSIAAYQQKQGEYERDLRQTQGSLAIAIALVKDLEAVVKES